MGPSLTILDSDFTKQYRGLIDIQQNVKMKLESYPFELSNTEITQAIIERMWAFWYFNVNNNKMLGREVNPTAADFFTETCVLFLKSYYGQKGIDVFSEKKLPGTKIRPDISMWKDEKLLAVVELKVSNGWKGKTIVQHLEDREKQVKEYDEKAYFGVLAFWNFFDTSSKDWNTKHFGLLDYDSNDRHQSTDQVLSN